MRVVQHRERAPDGRWAQPCHVDVVVAEVAARQHGVIGRAQLLTAGLGTEAIRHRVRAGRLHPLHRGVYAVGHPAVTFHGRCLAGVLAGGPGALLGRRSGAVLWGLLAPDGAVPDVIVTTGRRRPQPGVRLHRTRDVAPTEQRLRSAVPVTSPLRTLLDLAAWGDPREAIRAAEEAQVRRLVRPAELAGLVDRPGAPLLRRAAAPDGRMPFTRSEAERRLLRLVARAGLPRPRTNVRLAGHEVDALWPRERVVVEVDGYAFHSSPAAFDRDRRRDADLQAAGYRVLRLTWRALTDRPEESAARLAVLLAQASSGQGERTGTTGGRSA